jgi:hypothetical protein
MGRHSSSLSYGHRVKDVGGGCYSLFWTVDFHYPTSRLRHPRAFRRDTDAAGAKRFAKKWGLEMPAALTQA